MPGADRGRAAATGGPPTRQRSALGDPRRTAVRARDVHARHLLRRARRAGHGRGRPNRDVDRGVRRRRPVRGPERARRGGRRTGGDRLGPAAERPLPSHGLRRRAVSAGPPAAPRGAGPGIGRRLVRAGQSRRRQLRPRPAGLVDRSAGARVGQRHHRRRARRGGDRRSSALRARRDLPRVLPGAAGRGGRLAQGGRGGPARRHDRVCTDAGGAPGRAGDRRLHGGADRAEARMSAAWITIAVLCAGTVAIKSVGPLALGGDPPSERVAAVIRLIAPALLAALIVYEALSVDGHGPEFDARLVGVGAAALGLLARLPLLVIVALAALATALTRALG